MKKSLAVILVSMSVGTSFAQGRGPTRVGAPTNIGTAHNPTGNAGTTTTGLDRSSNVENSGKPSSTPPTDTGKSNAQDTGGFKNHGQYMAAQQVSEHLGIPLDQLKAKMTGDQAESLGKAIQDLSNLSPTQANAEAKKAEAAAKKAEAAAKNQRGN
jgi:hypothetical protein